MGAGQPLPLPRLTFASRAARGGVLRAGIVIEIWIVKGNNIGRVQRLVVERRSLVASGRCIHPTRVRSHACPPGS